MQEILESDRPISSSIDCDGQKTPWCIKCDNRNIKLPVWGDQDDILMRRQVTFQPTSATNGDFILDRFFRAGFSTFPSCRQFAENTAWKLIMKLDKYKTGEISFMGREIDYKVTKSFVNGRVVWMDEAELALPVQTTYLAQLCVVNTENLSSPLRLTLISNRPQKCGEAKFLSFNDMVRDCPVVLPRLHRYYFANHLASSLVFADIQDSFGSILHSAFTARQSLVLCLRDGQGQPTYQLNRSVDGKLHALKPIRAGFGAKDLPGINAYIVRQLVSQYRNHYQGNHKLDEIILNHLDEVCRWATYVDDSYINADHIRVLQYCQAKQIVIPFPTVSAVPCVEISSATV